MVDEGLDPILIQVTIPLPVPMIFSAFTDPAKLSNWLCAGAHIDLRLGGGYHLRFSNGDSFESRGTITTLTPDLDIGFTWEGPATYAELLNRPKPKTSVYVRLQDSPEGIDVTLEHSGWLSGEEWEDARSWHFHLWDERLTRLKEYLLKAAYG